MVAMSGRRMPGSPGQLLQPSPAARGSADPLNVTPGPTTLSELPAFSGIPRGRPAGVHRRRLGESWTPKSLRRGDAVGRALAVWGQKCPARSGRYASSITLMGIPGGALVD